MPKLAKSELNFFSSKSKSKIQNLPKYLFLHFIKQYQIEIRNTVYVYSDIFTMTIDIIRQIMEKISKNQIEES